MKAYIYKRAGGPEVLELVDLPKPQPKSDELLVKIVATPVNSGDTVIRKMRPLMMRLTGGFKGSKNNILGMYFSGVVETVGDDVKNFKVGDEVYGSRGTQFGTYAEYLCIAESKAVLLKPVNYSFEEAAGVMFGATTVCHFLNKAGIKEGEQVLVNAAAGAVGSAAVQIAKYYGATVTGVCSKDDFDLVTRLGADHLIDYRTEDFAENGQKYDIIYDTIGNLNFQCVKSSLSKAGRFVTNAAQSQDYIAKLFNCKRIVLGFSGDASLEEVTKMANEGKLESVIDSVFAFDDMQAAHAKTDSKKKTGNVIVRVAEI